MNTESRLVMQARVLFALVMREMATRFGRSAGGYVWALLEPAVAVALLTAVFSQIARSPPLGESFTLFFTTGYMAFHLYRDVSGEVSAAINANKALLVFPRVTMLDVILARTILQALTGVFVFLVVIVCVYMVTRVDPVIRVERVLLALALAVALGAGVGALNCLLFAYSQTWQRVFNLINRPLFLISGVFFLYEDMPGYIQAVLWWNPLMHVVSIMRSGFYPAYDAAFAAPAFPLGVSAAALMTGALLIRRVRSRILDQ